MFTYSKPFKFDKVDCAGAVLGFKDGIGSFHVSAVTGYGGSYYTNVPISGLDFRRRNPTAAAFRIHESGIYVMDDWGAAHNFEGPKDLVDQIKAECLAQQIPEAL